MCVFCRRVCIPWNVLFYPLLRLKWTIAYTRAWKPLNMAKCYKKCTISIYFVPFFPLCICLSPTSWTELNRCVCVYKYCCYGRYFGKIWTEKSTCHMVNKNLFWCCSTSIVKKIVGSPSLNLRLDPTLSFTSVSFVAPLSTFDTSVDSF